MTLEAKLAEAAACGLQQVLLYQTATGAWDCTARASEKTRIVIGHSTLRTPEGATARALDEFMSKAKAQGGSVFD